MERLYTSLHDIKTLQEKIDPGTEQGAIALAALNFGIDITRASSALREYKILKMNGRHEYIPVDIWMRHWYQRNPDMFDMIISFNPIFPSSYYGNTRLVSMAQREGYTPEEIALTPPYELMQLAYVSETFYLGEMPCIKSNQTCIHMDDITEIPYGALLCYGQIEHSMQIVSVLELVELFRANENFTNPFQPNAVFTNTNINKLKNILQDLRGPLPEIPLSSDVISMRQHLLDVIGTIELSMQSMDRPSRELCIAHRSAQFETKDAIRQALIGLLNAGMYMRGWMGSGHEYPVARAPVPPEYEIVVATNVTASITEFDRMCHELGSIGKLIENLPLVSYKDGQYHTSISDNDGRTIRERIEIVKQGETTRNIASCIRMSSNWLCASAHKYIILLGYPAPFDIFNLRSIY